MKKKMLFFACFLSILVTVFLSGLAWSMQVPPAAKPVTFILSDGNPGTAETIYDNRGSKDKNITVCNIDTEESMTVIVQNDDGGQISGPHRLEPVEGEIKDCVTITVPPGGEVQARDDSESPHNIGSVTGTYTVS